MSARSNATDLYPLKRDPVRRYVIALVLLFVVTILLLSVTEATLRINTRQMDQALDNQQARRELGQIVLRELFKLEVILYQLPALRDDLDLGVLRGQFDTALTKVKKVLDVLQRGGRFIDYRPTHFENTNQTSEVIEYAGPDGGYVIAAIEITPKLIEIEQKGERIFALVESQMYEERDLNRSLISGEVLSLLKRVQPTLLRCRESANKIYYETVMAITAQKAAKQTAARRYAGIRVCVIGGIGILGIVLCVRTQRRIGEILAAFVDISPLVEERRRAEAASQAKSDFLANMNHELCTPLNHIIGFTELVVDKHFGELNEVQAEYLSDVLASGRHLLSLINDILDLSKVEAGNLELQPSVFDLTEVLTHGLVLVKEKAHKHGIKVNFQAPPYTIGMTADERKVKQILYNLLANAVKFTPDGGAVDLSVRLSETRPEQGGAVEAAADADLSGGENGWILLCVRDTGIGLSGDDLERIFKPFEQVDQSTERHYEGTGLGLSLTRQMVALHGGRIWAESDGENRGSRFYVSLPRRVAVVA